MADPARWAALLIGSDHEGDRAHDRLAQDEGSRLIHVAQTPLRSLRQLAPVAVAQLDLVDLAGAKLGQRRVVDPKISRVLVLGDAVGRLTGLGHDLAGASYDQSLGFTYNPAGQIVTRTGANDAYAHDTAYNVSRAYVSNGLNQYTLSGSATLSYDANGNLVSDGSTSFVYDDENRLVSATGGHTATLSYDPLGRLWQVTGSSGTTRFLYDGDRLAIEYDSAGTLLRSYDHGAGPDEPLVWYEAVPGGTSRRYLHADHQGSIVAVADQNGNPIAVNAYDSWGIPNSGNQGRFGFTGQAWIPELGMWYYKARMYSPTLGRFMQTDPVGYGGGMNPYAYAENDPVNARDPSGLEYIPIVAIITGRILRRLDFPGFPPPATGTADEVDQTLRARAEHDGLGRSMPPSKKNSIKLRPSTKKYLCNRLNLYGFNIPGTYSDILAFRNSSHANMQILEAREAENWIYATGNWRTIPTDGTSRFFVRLYQKYYKPIFSNATPYSEDALNAGLNGADHRGETQAQLSGELKDYCSAH